MIGLFKIYLNVYCLSQKSVLALAKTSVKAICLIKSIKITSCFLRKYTIICMSMLNKSNSAVHQNNNRPSTKSLRISQLKIKENSSSVLYLYVE